MSAKRKSPTTSAKAVQFLHPPVQEVVYQIRAVVPAPPDLNRIKADLAKDLKKDYPIAEDFNLFQHTVQPGALGIASVQVQGGLFGLRFRNRKGTQVVHFTPTGLVINWIKPYPGYEKCITKAKRLWRLYAKYYNPISVETVSMRYIDRIPVPLTHGSVNMGEYITIGSNAPDIAGLSISGFNQVTEYQKIPEHIRMRVNLATLKPEDHVLPVLLDHEAFIDLKGHTDRTDHAIWPSFDKVHTWSLQFFHGSLTPQGLALFK
ncbi:MAG: TIGR04255 family protein [Flavobacteriales bacterium]|nr:TIGR04255 family protein [Flavobacteriales bacterium]